MVFCVLKGVQWHEEIGHYAAPTIDNALFAQGVTLQRVGKMDAVRIGQLAMLQAVVEVHLIVAQVTFLIRFLYAAAAGGVVVGNGQADHRAVGQVDGALNQSFAVRPAAHHGATVLVLDGAGDDFSCRGSELVDENHHLSFHQFAISFGAVLGPLARFAALRIDNKVVLFQEFIGYLDGCLQVAAAIVLQIEQQVFHALLLQGAHTFHELIVGGGPEIGDADITDARPYHIDGINRLDGNLVAGDDECQLVGNAAAHHAQFHLGSLLAAQTFHDVFFRHLDTGDSGVVDRYDAVAGHDAHLLRGTVHHRLDDYQRVLNHIKLHADTVEVALQRFVHGLHLFGCGIGGVGVQLFQHAADGIFHQFRLIHRVDI